MLAHICMKSDLLVMGIEYVEVVGIEVKLILRVKWIDKASDSYLLLCSGLNK